VCVKEGAIPLTVWVTGTTFVGSSIEFVAFGAAESTVAVALDRTERRPLTSMVSVCGAASGLTCLTKIAPLLLFFVTEVRSGAPVSVARRMESP